MTTDSKPDTEYSNLFDILVKRKQPTRLVEFPAFDENGKSLCNVLIRTLTHDDHVEIQKNATLECDRIYKDQNIDKDNKIYRERHDNITAKHFIYRACRDPENEKKPFFPTPDHVGRHLSNDEISILLKQYETLQTEVGPIIAYMDDKQFEEWVVKLGQAAEQSPYFLDRFLPETKDQFLMYMARQLWRLQTDNCSATSQAKESLSVSPNLET